MRRRPGATSMPRPLQRTPLTGYSVGMLENGSLFGKVDDSFGCAMLALEPPPTDRTLPSALLGKGLMARPVLLSLLKGLHLTLLTTWLLSVASTQSSQPYPSPQHKPYLLALISRLPLLAVLCAAFRPPQLPVPLASVSSTSVMLACRGAQILS